MILAPLLKLPKTLGDLDKFIAAKSFKKLPKVQKIANSGHTVHKCVGERLKIKSFTTNRENRHVLTIERERERERNKGQREREKNRA